MRRSRTNIVRGLKFARISALVALLLLSRADPASAVRTPSEELITYRSESGGFEVGHPRDWSVSTQSIGTMAGVVFQSPVARDGDEFMYAIVGIGSKPSNEVKGRCKRRDDHLSELYKDQVVSTREITVDGIKAERVETASKIDRDIIIYVEFSSSDRRYCVTGDFPRAYNLERHAPVFDEMLKSFRLLPTAKPDNGTHPTPRHAAPHNLELGRG